MENSKLIRIAQKISTSVKTDLVYEIVNVLQYKNSPFYQMVSVLSGMDFVKLVYLISRINLGEKEFESILWTIENEGFTYSLGEVIDSSVRETCGSCGGDGQEDCNQCDGTGEEDCSYCDGNGEDEEGNTCEDCDGSGKTECGWCDGDGHLNCDTCDGTGDIEQDDTYEISVDYFFSIDEEIELELSELERFDEIESDKIENYRTNNKTFMIDSQVEIHETRIELTEDYTVSYFMGLDGDGEVYGKGRKPSTSLH